MPDVEIKSLKSNDLVSALLNNSVIFDFATNYYYSNPTPEIDQFSFTETDFDSFKNFVSKSEFNFETKTEKALKEALLSKGNELLGPEVVEDTKKLLITISKSKGEALDTFESEIQKQLEDEIVKRYFYREGLYDFYLINDAAIVTANTLLKDRSKYDAILK
jgi:carboxyl-terminal processing protease